jgi:hypothetical protein
MDMDMEMGVGVGVGFRLGMEVGLGVGMEMGGGLGKVMGMGVEMDVGMEMDMVAGTANLKGLEKALNSRTHSSTSGILSPTLCHIDAGFFYPLGVKNGLGGSFRVGGRTESCAETTKH